MDREMASVPPQAHWLFKPTAGEPACLCIVVYADGDYWVFGSPSGSYSAGHADKGRWRLVEEGYLREGYVREAEAKATGLIPSEWSRPTPDPEASWQRTFRRRRAVGLLVLVVVLGFVSLILFT
jgi:hypothetical protein